MLFNNSTKTKVRIIMSIKKDYVELVDFLKFNKDKKVSTLLDQIELMCSAKVKNSTSMYTEEGKLIAIYCYYHKQWELVDEVVYGKKSTSKTGLNTMCKIGTSKWTKQQKQAKEAEANILQGIVSGKIKPEEIVNYQADIEEVRVSIDTTDMPRGFKTEEEVLEAIK